MQQVECLTNPCFYVTKPQGNNQHHHLSLKRNNGLILFWIRFRFELLQMVTLMQCQQCSCLAMFKLLRQAKMMLHRFVFQTFQPGEKNLESTSTFTWFCTTFLSIIVSTHSSLNTARFFWFDLLNFCWGKNPKGSKTCSRLKINVLNVHYICYWLLTYLVMNHFMV